MEEKVRVRFAPSPTGPLHIGGVRTALFNYLFAKKHKGDFLLRIEDTDQTRFVPGAEEYIIEALEWCGITIDEGIREGGAYGPYRQSDRKALYVQYADQLINSGDGYYAFDTAEELDKARADFEARGEMFTYNSSTRMSMCNSLSLGVEETTKKIAAGVPYVIRFKMPIDEVVTENDIVRGDVSFNTTLLDDKVLFKSDGMPTYHLANVVDDHLMKISHVIRGEEWLSSMPLHVLLYRKLGWESPRFAHLPLILKPEGKGKLSKRDGDKMGFPVFPLLWTDPKSGEVSRGYREDGYLPDAFVNMLVFLGWNPGTDHEIYTLEQLTALFSLERIGKSGSKFDPEKAKWFNHQYLMHKSDNEIALLFSKLLVEKNIEVSFEYTLKVVSMLKERATFVKDIWDQGYYFFQAPTEYDQQTVKKKWKENVPPMIKEIRDFLEGIDTWIANDVKEKFSTFVTEKEWGFGVIMNAFRLCIVGAGLGADLFEICEMIGKTETIKRLDKGLAEIKN